MKAVPQDFDLDEKALLSAIFENLKATPLIPGYESAYYSYQGIEPVEPVEPVDLFDPQRAKDTRAAFKKFIMQD